MDSNHDKVIQSLLARKALCKGDSLVVWKLDRLGRSLKGLVDFVTEFETRQVHFRSLTDEINQRIGLSTLYIQCATLDPDSFLM